MGVSSGIMIAALDRPLGMNRFSTSVKMKMPMAASARPLLPIRLEAVLEMVCMMWPWFNTIPTTRARPITTQIPPMDCAPLKKVLLIRFGLTRYRMLANTELSIMNTYRYS